MEKNYNIADAEWEWYIGQLYYKLISNLCDKLDVVVELGPGFRYKIADALKEIDFSGTLYIVDYSSDVLDYCYTEYKKKIPNAKIVCINKKIEDMLSFLPDKIDLLVSNHIIDDLIITKYSNMSYNKDTNDESLYSNLLELWEKLYNDEINKNKITNDVINTFESIFKSKKIDMVIMSQYQSNSYYLNNSHYIDLIVDDCFNKIKKLTDTNDDLVNKLLDFYPFGAEDERYNGTYLTDNTQNAKNWIAGRIKKDLTL